LLSAGESCIKTMDVEVGSGFGLVVNLERSFGR
jgi:hypothetical protein